MTVATLASDKAPEVITLLCESFFDYPVMRFVVGGDESGYGPRLEILIRLFVMARVFRGELMLGLGEPSALGGVALVSRPEGETPPEFTEFREGIWAQLGDGPRARYDACGEAWAPLDVERPNLHLNMIGVRRKTQGRGAGRRLADHVHRLSREDPHSEGVTLTTENEANVSFYRHLGYELVGEQQIAPGLRTWGFFRPD